MQSRLMLSGTVVIYRVRARIQCWHKVLLFPVLAGFALVNMPFSQHGSYMLLSGRSVFTSMVRIPDSDQSYNLEGFMVSPSCLEAV